MTGKSTDEVAGVLSHVTGRRNITEVYLSEIEAALKYMRYTFELRSVSGSMYSFFVQASQEPGFYLLSLPNHIVAIEVTKEHKVFFCDNHTKEPINGSSSARLGQQCKAAYKVEPKPEPKFVESKLDFIINDVSSPIHVTISMWDIYEVEEDNTRREIGTLRVKDKQELKLIRDEMLRRF